MMMIKRQGNNQADMDATTRRVPQVQREDHPSRAESWFLKVVLIIMRVTHLVGPKSEPISLDCFSSQRCFLNSALKAQQHRVDPKSKPTFFGPVFIPELYHRYRPQCCVESAEEAKHNHHSYDQPAWEESKHETTRWGRLHHHHHHHHCHHCHDQIHERGLHP